LPFPGFRGRLWLLFMQLPPLQCPNVRVQCPMVGQQWTRRRTHRLRARRNRSPALLHGPPVLQQRPQVLMQWPMARRFGKDRVHRSLPLSPPRSPPESSARGLLSLFRR
jgi:hypothetical protein